MSARCCYRLWRSVDHGSLELAGWGVDSGRNFSSMSPLPRCCTIAAGAWSGLISVRDGGKEDC
jgi:hypothetical protein